MGQDLSYQAGTQTYEYRISRADWELVKSLQEHLPTEVTLLFVVAALGDEVRIPTTSMREAASRVLAFVAENKQLLPYTYQYKAEIPPDPQMTPGFNTGGLSGIRLLGDSDHRYSIRVGLNVCRLEKRAIGPDGRGIKISERDLRGERKLLTENRGVITIRRTRAKTDLLKALAEIKHFLNSVSVLEIAKTID